MNKIPFISKDVATVLKFAIAPLITLTLGKILFELFGFNLPRLSEQFVLKLGGTQTFPASVILAETKARMLWLTSIMLYLFLYTGFVTIVWNSLVRTLRRATQIWLIAIVGLLASLEIGYLTSVDHAKSPLVTIFRFTFDSLTVSGRFSADKLMTINVVLDVVNLLAIVIPIFGVLAGCCILKQESPSSMSDHQYWLRKSDQLKHLIAGGSGIMVIGIVHMNLWLNWPLSLMADAEAAGQYKKIIETVVQYWGVIYSVAIAAFYLPAATYLGHQTEKALMGSEESELKKNTYQWLKDHKLLMSPLAHLPQIVAVLAPMLVGSFNAPFTEVVRF